MWNLLLIPYLLAFALAEQVCKVQEGAKRLEKAGCPEIYDAYNCEGVVETLELDEDSESCSGIWHAQWNFVAEGDKLEFPEIKKAGSALLSGDAVIFERKHKLHQWTELARNRELRRALEAHERGEIQFAESHYEPMTVEQEVGMLNRVADAYAHYELHDDAEQLRSKAAALERRRRLGLTGALSTVSKAGKDFCKTGACETMFKVGMEKMFEMAEGLDQDFCEKDDHLKYYQNLSCCGGNQCFLFFCHMDGTSCGNFFHSKEPIHCCDGWDYNPQSLRCYKESEVCPWGMTSCSLVGPFAPAPYCSRGAGACWSKVAELVFKAADVAVSIGGMIMTAGASTAIKTGIKTGAKALAKGMTKAVARATLKTAFKQAFKAIAKKLRSIIIDQFKAVAQELIFTYIVEEVSMTLAGKNAQDEGWISSEDLIGMCDPTAIYDLVKFFENIDDCKYYETFTQDQLDEMRLQSIMNAQELKPEEIAPYFGNWKGRYESWMDYKYIKLSIDCEGTLSILGLASSMMLFDKEYVLDMCGYDPKYDFVVFDLWGSDYYDCGYIQGLLKLQRFRDSDKTLVEGFEMTALHVGHRDAEMPCTEEKKRRRLADLGHEFTEEHEESEIAVSSSKMVKHTKRSSECDWNGVDSSNIVSLGGGGHSQSECLRACENRALCNFAALSSPSGYCHLFETCNGEGRDKSGWTLWYKESNDDCIDVTVGSSGYSNAKTVHVDEMYDCPKEVDKTKWDKSAAQPYENAGDLFSTSRTGSQLTVTRMDAHSGWGLNLKFECCSSNRDEQHYFVDFEHQYGTWNQNKCDAFLSETQCEELATIEDFISYSKKTDSEKPRGCIVDWNGNIIFNTAGEGSKSHMWAPICKERAPADYSTVSNVNVEIMAGATNHCDNYLSPAECEDFAGDMGDPVVSEFYKEDMPAGCLIDFTNSKRFLYNTVPDGSHGEGDIDVAPVCKICDNDGENCTWNSKVSEDTEGEKIFVYRASVLGEGFKQITYDTANTFCRDQGLMLASPRNHYDVNEVLKQAAELMSLMREEDIKKGQEEAKNTYNPWYYYTGYIEKDVSREIYATGDYTPKILLGLKCNRDADCSKLENWKWPDGSSSTGANFKYFKEGRLQDATEVYLSVEEYETKYAQDACKQEMRYRDMCKAGYDPYGMYRSCNDAEEWDQRVKSCMDHARSTVTTPQRNEWEKLSGKGKEEFDQCGYLNWEDSEGATMIETEVCENAIYNVFACQTMTKKGLPRYEPSKCAPRNRKASCASKKIRKECLRTTEDESFNDDSDLNCVWCTSGNCAEDKEIRCATRKFMEDLGKTVSPNHKKSTIVGYKDDTAIVEEVDSIGMYEYCKVVAEDATEEPSTAPTSFGRSVDIWSKIGESTYNNVPLVEGYLKIRDSDSGDWGIVCNVGVTKHMREISCNEMGYKDTYEVDVKKKYDSYGGYGHSYGYYDYGMRSPYGSSGNGEDGSSITHWEEMMGTADFAKYYDGAWYKMGDCQGNEDSLNECAYEKTEQCNEGVFVIGCKNFEAKPGCSNYVAKVNFEYHTGHYSSSYGSSTSREDGYSDGYDEGYGVIFHIVHKDYNSNPYDYVNPESMPETRILVYTDYDGKVLKDGVMTIDNKHPSDDWKNTLNWQNIDDKFSHSSTRITEFHIQCGRSLSQSLLSSFGFLKVVHILALIGVLSVFYFVCRKSKTNDFTLVMEEET